jgi:hypothetical protein
VRIPEDATHKSVVFFGQKVRIYLLRWTHVCDLFDFYGTAPSVPIISNHTHAVLFPTWLEPGCGDYTHPLNIAKKKIKKCKGAYRESRAPQGKNSILSDLRRTNLSICSVLNIYNFCFNGCRIRNCKDSFTGAWHEDRDPGSG